MPVEKFLGIWPRRIPISLRYHPSDPDDNTITTLKQHRDDRVSEITFDWVTIFGLKRFAAELFPALTSLVLGPHEFRNVVLRLPETFLNGSTPSLRTITLEISDFPALPRLVSSAPHLVSLKLDKIPVSACYSSEAMANILATSINLEKLDIDFRDPFVHPDYIRPPSLPRAVFPVLAYFNIKGISECLEDFVARIDAPILRTLSITFKHSNMHVPQILRLISRAERFTPPKIAVFKLSLWNISLKFGSSDSFALEIVYDNGMEGGLLMSIICRELSPLLSHVVCLGPVDEIASHLPMPPWWYFIRCTHWLEVFRPFNAVQSPRVANTLSCSLGCALPVITSDAGLLPELRTLFLDSHPLVSALAAFELFVSACQLSGRQIDVQLWER